MIGNKNIEDTEKITIKNVKVYHGSISFPERRKKDLRSYSSLIGLVNNPNVEIWYTYTNTSLLDKQAPGHGLYGAIGEMGDIPTAYDSYWNIACADPGPGCGWGCTYQQLIDGRIDSTNIYQFWDTKNVWQWTKEKLPNLKDFPTIIQANTQLESSLYNKKFAI